MKATNITQNKIQTAEIICISFDEKAHETFFREMEEYKERRRYAMEKLKTWNAEKDATYLE